MSCSYDINVDIFQQYTRETRELYLKLYPWYFMPVTVHKILVHSPDVIKTCILLIGQLSEEAQEARNKDLRRFREGHTRKNSRICTNEDLLKMLLITSDPVISSLRSLAPRKKGSLSQEVLSMLLNSGVAPVEDCPTSSDTDSE